MSILKDIQNRRKQLDELSKDTIKRYVQSASISSLRNHAGADNAILRIPSAKTKEVKDTHMKVADNLRDKASKRDTSIAVAKSKLREEIESLLEAVKGKPGPKRKARHEDGEIVNDPRANS